MKGEIDSVFCCSGFHYENGKCSEGGDCIRQGCNCYHRKWPTPEQFEKEYGEEYNDEGTVYAQHHNIDWMVSYWGNVKDCFYDGKCLVVCACTPFGKPNRDWRPE